ncbi:MAG: tRNA guanosine(34) transglycosylase Tgt [Patescibacteria group bacterium]
MKSITIKGTTHNLPIFLPDATRAVVKSLSGSDIKNVGTRGAVINTYHLADVPGSKFLDSNGGVKRFMNFSGLTISDSGGWQVFSLIHRNNTPGKITDEGVKFSIGGAKNQLFTPELSINTQFAIGSDVIICLDDFTPPDATPAVAQLTVNRTILWAQQCKRAYDAQIKARGLTDSTRPHIFAVVQGGYYKELREQCAAKLQEIGFDGYGYGGYVVGDDGQLDLDMSQYLAQLLPDDKPKFALGMGRPWDIASLYSYGWDIFDCTLPTRDARHKRLYAFKTFPQTFEDLTNKDEYEYVPINRGRYAEDFGPIDSSCDCETCVNHSRAYLYHLFKIGDVSAYRLATLHNLRFYNRVVDLLTQLA